MNFKNSLKRARWVEKLQSHMRHIFHLKRRPDKFDKKSFPQALPGADNSSLSVGVERAPWNSLNSYIFFSFAYLISCKLSAKTLSYSPFFGPAFH
jgi:hypothetical protein